MSREKVTKMYHQLMVINVVCIISSVMFIVLNQFDWIPKIWGICISLLAFLTNSQEEQILSENPSNSSIYLLATDYLACMIYIASISFLLGRMVVGMMC